MTTKAFYEVITTTKFKKDLRHVRKCGADLNKVYDVIQLLKEGKELPERFANHPLRGEFLGDYECHIEPDLLLIYNINNGLLILKLIRIGSHSELF